MYWRTLQVEKACFLPELPGETWYYANVSFDKKDDCRYEPPPPPPLVLMVSLIHVVNADTFVKYMRRHRGYKNEKKHEPFFSIFLIFSGNCCWFAF